MAGRRGAVRCRSCCICSIPRPTWAASSAPSGPRWPPRRRRSPDAPVRDPDLRARPGGRAPAGGHGPPHGAGRARRPERRADRRRHGAAGARDRDLHPRRPAHRRAVHRDQGGARRRLRRRGPRPRPRAGDRPHGAHRRGRRGGPAAHGLPGHGGRHLTTVEQEVADAHRREWAYVLAATVRVTRDLDAAEEAVQDAYVAALGSWARDGVPDRPGAWLTTAARRTALNAMARRRTLEAKLPLLVDPQPAEAPMPGADSDPDVIPDDRLRLVFTCCHPALAREAQVALTLRLVCGVPTPDVAHAFLVSEPTMAARITRAKKKIAGAGIPYAVPEAAELPARLDAVLTVVHLLAATAHAAPTGDGLVRDDLAERALDLARMV